MEIVEALRTKRATAAANGDWNLVREIDDYAARCGFVFETAEPPQMEHAVPVMRRGPGRPPKETS